MPDKRFREEGYCIIEEVISARECERLIWLIDQYRGRHELSQIHRAMGERPLHYSVIDGAQVRQHLPSVVSLAWEVGILINRIAGQSLTLMTDERVGCNVNITQGGGSYRWHYDRNPVTAILYLNEVAGGETECYPNYRVLLPRARYSRFQRWVDQLLQWKYMRSLFGARQVVKPRAGRLLIIGGDKCLHSVSPVIGSEERIAMIFSYELPQTQYAVAQGLNAYLYHSVSASSSDPNYT